MIDPAAGRPDRTAFVVVRCTEPIRPSRYVFIDRKNGVVRIINVPQEPSP